MNKDIDILKELDIQKEIETLTMKTVNENDPKEKIQKHNKKFSLASGLLFITKYLITSSLIFGILLLSTNYSAYVNIAKSYIYSGEMKITEQRLINSVEATNIKEKYKKISKEKNIKEKYKKIDTKLSISKLKKKEDNKEIELNIKITPYDNRVIIPKIGKNIPLIDIKNRNISGEKELNNIFAKELENGIIRYPSSSKPGENGTSFIFGHSSNYPWIKGDYNDVFATLDNVSYGDEIIVYYGQKKYTYKIKEKKVISPGDVSVLKRNKNKSEITLMTCRPVGTTLNRLIVTGELIKK